MNSRRVVIVGAGFGGLQTAQSLADSGADVLLIAWLMWLGVHLVYLPGYRSRLLVLLTWLHTYLLRDRSVRLIFSMKER